MTFVQKQALVLRHLRQHFIIALLCLIALQASAGTSPAVIESNDQITGTVFQVKDGDSIVVRSEGKFIEVRLHGIDAPEWKQPYGDKAKKKLRSLVLFKEVILKPVTVDSYDRLVSIVYVNDKNINLEMVKTGNAWWYKRFANKDKALKKAQANAKSEKLGLWYEKKPIPPWEWRHTN